MATAHVVTKKLPPRLLSSVVVGPPESSRGGRGGLQLEGGVFAAAGGGERPDSLEPSVRTSCSTSIAQTHSSDFHAGLATRAVPTR